ncbi:MAG: excinuclease ABC subunit UvrC [Lachnospiraceae bacterium]|nr:excinuclease ABC subunit UvrC [Lachnospiraceae bacterium]
MNSEQIQEELTKLPKSPGVYIMHDSKGGVLYVGKAVNLRNRVRSYFRVSTKKTLKIQKMVSLIDHFDYILTDTELEALVLENNLIKEYSPKYNTLLKDDKTYPYIKVTVNEPFPRLIFSRSLKKDKSKYFGPYSSAGSVNDMIEFLSKIYHIRTCNRAIDGKTTFDRPCLNYHMKQCDAPCMNKITEEEYKENVKKALVFLGGNYDPLLKEIEEKMYELSEKLEFEEAAKYRELLRSATNIAQKQKITDFDGENKDYIGIAGNEKDVLVQVFFVREGKLIGREHFYMKGATENTDEENIESFIKQYYAGTPFIPKEIFIPVQLEEGELLEKWLSEKIGGKVSIKSPVKGQKEKMLELAHSNALMLLKRDEEKHKLEEARTKGATEELASLLDIVKADRIESYDISNTQGFNSVGSMVVYENGRPKKSDYRKFRLKTVEGPDDYASMYEVLNRRFTHGINEIEGDNTTSFAIFPDLILMDGGRGQVHVAEKVLSELGIDVPVCGMVKDDRHRTRGLLFKDREIPIDTHSECFKFVTRVQDEVHRFAIEYHRSLRTKAQVHSILDDIPGIGDKRRRALMKYFKSIDELKAASVEEISKVEGIPVNVAEEIYNFFRKEKRKEKNTEEK